MIAERDQVNVEVIALGVEDKRRLVPAIVVVGLLGYQILLEVAKVSSRALKVVIIETMSSVLETDLS